MPNSASDRATGPGGSPRPSASSTPAAAPLRAKKWSRLDTYARWPNVSRRTTTPAASTAVVLPPDEGRGLDTPPPLTPGRVAFRVPTSRPPPQTATRPKIPRGSAPRGNSAGLPARRPFGGNAGAQPPRGAACCAPGKQRRLAGTSPFRGERGGAAPAG